jgi:hypothetical protein
VHHLLIPSLKKINPRNRVDSNPEVLKCEPPAEQRFGSLKRAQYDSRPRLVSSSIESLYKQPTADQPALTRPEFLEHIAMSSRKNPPWKPHLTLPEFPPVLTFPQDLT